LFWDACECGYQISGIGGVWPDLDFSLDKSVGDGNVKIIQRGFIVLRVALFVGIILIIIGACILLLSLWKAGSIILTIAAVGVAAIHTKLIAVALKGGSFDRTQKYGIIIAATTLPPIGVRAAYLVLIQFSQDGKYNPILGNAAYLIGMVLTMEVMVMTSLLAATVVSEQLFGVGQKVPLGREGRGMPEKESGDGRQCAERCNRSERGTSERLGPKSGPEHV
jgi:hypothetical protein